MTASKRICGRSRLENISTVAALPTVSTRLAPAYERCAPLEGGGGGAPSPVGSSISSVSAIRSPTRFVRLVWGPLARRHPAPADELPHPARSFGKQNHAR